MKGADKTKKAQKGILIFIKLFLSRKMPKTPSSKLEEADISIHSKLKKQMLSKPSNQA